jgi:concentrative nucleoside transporter, CNT family
MRPRLAPRSLVDSNSIVYCDHSLDDLPIYPHHGCLQVCSRLERTDFRPLYWTWKHTFVVIGNTIPERAQIPAAAIMVIAVVLVGTFASPTSADNSYQNRGISIAGLAIFYLGLYATSANRKKIVWRTVLVGLLCQYVLALFVLRTQCGYDIFNFISFLAR